MKERLTGAIILVALIVLLVPELLTGPVRSAPGAARPSRSSGEAPLRSYTINLTEESHARGAAPASGPEQPALLATAAPEGPAAAPNGPAAPPNGPAAAPAVASAAAPQNSTPRPPAAPAPAPAAGSTPLVTAVNAAPLSEAGSGLAAAVPESAASAAWMVQLGSFASRANAEHLAGQMRARGFAVSVSRGASGRRLYRVRVGPAHDRAGAMQLAQKLHASGYSGSVVPR